MLKILTRFMVAVAASLTLLAGSALASANGSTDKIIGAGSKAASADLITIISEPRHIETKSRKKRKKKKKKKRYSKRKSIAQIRDKAIRNTLGGLGELRPYTTNYNRLKAAVRRYWRRNATHPTTNGLARTIMRYVKRKDRKLVRSEVYSGSKSGVNKVKRELKKRRKR